MDDDNIEKLVFAINEYIKDRLQQKEGNKVFFRLTVEQNGKKMPLAENEEGKNFYLVIMKYIRKYDNCKLIVELFHGKAYNLNPMRTDIINLPSRNPLAFGNPADKEDIKIVSGETLISPEKYYTSLSEKDRSILQMDFQLKLLEKERDELIRKNKKRKAYIIELEEELKKSGKNNTGGLGNIALGNILHNALIKFSKSDTGKDLLGGVLSGEDEKENKEEPKSTARVITKTEGEEKPPLTKQQQQRALVLKTLNEFLSKADDGTLRLYYEIVAAAGCDKDTLHIIYSLLQKSAKNKEKEQQKEESEEEEQNPNNNDT